MASMCFSCNSYSCHHVLQREQYNSLQNLYSALHAQAQQHYITAGTPGETGKIVPFEKTKNSKKLLLLKR